MQQNTLTCCSFMKWYCNHCNLLVVVSVGWSYPISECVESTRKLALTHWGQDKMAINFPEDIFKCIFLNENVWISIKISLKFVPQGTINGIPSLVQILAWRWPGDKPLSEPMMVRLPMHIYASPGLNELSDAVSRMVTKNQKLTCMHCSF